MPHGAGGGWMPHRWASIPRNVIAKPTVPPRPPKPEPPKPSDRAARLRALDAAVIEELNARQGRS